MALENLETPSFEFGIEHTMEMGNTELLNDLYAPETSTANPDEIKEVVKEVKPTIPEQKPSKKVKEIIPEEFDENGNKKEPTAQDLISSFLGGDDEEEETEEVEETQTETSEDTPGETQFTALANDLFKLGVFNKDEDEEDVVISTPEEFLERFKSEKQKGAIEIVNNFIAQFGQDYQEAFDAIYVKGVNPKEYWGAYANIASLAEVDLTQESNQEMVVRKSLQDQGWEDEDINDEVQRLKNNADLEDVAAKHHKILVKQEAKRLKEKEAHAEQEMQQRAAIRNLYIQNVQAVLQEKVKAKEFDGIPLNPKLASELQDFLLVDKYKTKSGETLTDFDKAILDLKKPENHAQKVKLALLLKIMEKDPTLSTIQRSGISKKSDQLFSEVARQVQKTKTTPAAKPKSWFQ